MNWERAFVHSTGTQRILMVFHDRSSLVLEDGMNFFALEYRDSEYKQIRFQEYPKNSMHAMQYEFFDSCFTNTDAMMTGINVWEQDRMKSFGRRY